MNRFLPLLLLMAVGCGTATVPNPAPAEVSGKVIQQGKPVDGVSLNLHPTGLGHPAVVPIKAGEFKATVTPGTYTYYFTQAKSKEAFAKIPKEFREGSLDRQIEIAPGSNLELVVN